MKVRDRVTGFTGVVSSVSFDLYGCVQAVVTQGACTADKGQVIGDQHWFDVKRLETQADVPVMAVPDFEQPEIGAAEKPAYQSQPRR